MAEEQEGSSKFTTGFKSEILLNGPTWACLRLVFFPLDFDFFFLDLPRLRSLASSTESLRQLESVVLDVQGPSNGKSDR
jgi:hypothetical protein